MNSELHIIIKQMFNFMGAQMGWTYHLGQFEMMIKT
jgi:hypothetical protein